MNMPLHKQSNAPISPYAAPHADIGTGTSERYNHYHTEPFYAKNGRIGRVRYIAYSVLINFVTIALLTVGAILVSIVAAIAGSEGLLMGIVSLLVVIATLILQIYGIFAPAKRRLNDVNQSGWVSLLLLFPFINLLFWLYLMLSPGTEGVNDYGAPAEPPSKLMIVIATVMPLIALVGILAAIAIPAYQDYALRSQIAQLSAQP